MVLRTTIQLTSSCGSILSNVPMVKYSMDGSERREAGIKAVLHESLQIITEQQWWISINMILNVLNTTLDSFPCFAFVLTSQFQWSIRKNSPSLHSLFSLKTGIFPWLLSIHKADSKSILSVSTLVKGAMIAGFLVWILRSGFYLTRPHSDFEHIKNLHRTI